MTYDPRREQLIHQLKLNEKEHDEKLQREKAKRMAKVQVSQSFSVSLVVGAILARLLL